MTGSHTPELSVRVQGLVAKEPHVVTVLIATAAFDEGRLDADINVQPNSARQSDKPRRLIHFSCDGRIVRRLGGGERERKIRFLRSDGKTAAARRAATRFTRNMAGTRRLSARAPIPSLARGFTHRRRSSRRMRMFVVAATNDLADLEITVSRFSTIAAHRGCHIAMEGDGTVHDGQGGGIKPTTARR